ncbi:MAG TPA: condensation domain-containing protein, partial [Longimicrobium sp.]|nr:condensation domain-containing protein [Longimicrobium sp.]
MSVQDADDKRAALSDTKRALLERRLRGDAAGPRPRATIGRVAGPGPEFPASFAQERMWFLCRFSPESPMYNIPFGVLVPASVNVPVLERALTETVRRHEALRTTYRMDENGQLLQVVQPPRPVGVEVIDVRGRVGADFAGDVTRLIAEEGARLFDLERPPLVRVTLLRVSDDEYAMVTTTHHVATDGWSYPLMSRDVLACYEAYLHGREPALPEPPRRYADYAVWQRARLRGDALQAQVRYWRELLEGAPALELPTDRPRPPVASNRGRSYRFRLGDGVAERLRETCRAQSATLNMVLLAGWAALLARYAGQDDVLLGTLLASRPHPELEEVVGMFVNTAALRLRLPPGATFRQAVALARGAVLQADQHQDLPFERLVDELGVERDLSRHPVFQVVYFHHVNATGRAGAPPRPPALPMRALPGSTGGDAVDTGVAKFDLQLATTEGPAGVSGNLEYATDLFDEATVARMARHLEQLLDAATRAPDAPLSSHALAPGDERLRLLAEWSAGPAVEVPSRPVHRRFAAQAARTPHAVAVVAGGERVTYGELDAWSDRIAGALRARGAAPGEIVGVHVDRGAGMVAALLGILKTGAAYLPLDPVYPPERIAYMVQDSGAVLVLADPGSFAGAEGVVFLPPRPSAGESVEAVSVE